MTRNALVLALTSTLAVACGGGGGGGERPEPPVNMAPTLDTLGNQSVEENTTLVATVSGSDQPGASLTFSLSGDDAASFTLASSGGDLFFAEAPDFENPTDVNEDNVYELTVTVSDGSLSDSESITVTVTDVLDDLAGRVVDGPVSGSVCKVFVNGAETGDTATTDGDGFYIINGIVAEANTELRCEGGTDTSTGNVLSGLVLSTDVLEGSGEANVNAITTVPASVDTPEAKQEILDKLGINATPEELIESDIWAGATDVDEDAQAAQRVNAQLSTLLTTTLTIVSEATGGAADPVDVVAAVAEQIVEAVNAATEELSLADPAIVSGILSDSVETAAPEAEIAEEVIEAVSNVVADVNSVLGDETQNPTSDTSTGVAGAAQSDLQNAVSDVTSGQTDVTTFEEETDPDTLFEEVPVDAGAPDNDNDGIPDVTDPDDDNDGVTDAVDAFPFDETESLDTDSDGQGNNADPDDDGDSVLDGADAYPLDPVISETALEVARGSQFTITDYNPTTMDNNAFTSGFSLSGASIVVDITSDPLNQANMANAVSGGDFQSPTIQLPIVAVPDGAESATATVSVLDGSDSQQDTGERVISFDLELEWVGDGSTLTVELPSQVAEGYYETSEGTRVDVTIENFESDFMSVSEGGVNIPATLDFKLAALIAKVESFLPSSFVRVGTYNLSVAFSGVPLYVSGTDNVGVVIDNIEVTFTLE